MNKGKCCANCFEYEWNCRGCIFKSCIICDEELTESESYEYRGVISCAKDFEELQQRRNEQREKVMEITNASVSSQRKGEFINSNKKYNLQNVMPDGLPIVKINEPLILKDYEDGKL